MRFGIEKYDCEAFRVLCKKNYIKEDQKKAPEDRKAAAAAAAANGATNGGGRGGRGRRGGRGGRGGRGS